MKVADILPACLLIFTVPGAHAGSLEGLRFLAGCWASVDAEHGSGEQWMPPAGNTMLGVGRTVRDRSTVAYEFLRIEQLSDGSIVLVAAPSGQAPATFTLVSQSAHAVTFENPEHDFPQRVSYRLRSDDLLVGRIDGTVDGVERSAEFPMKKTPCDTP